MRSSKLAKARTRSFGEKSERLHKIVFCAVDCVLSRPDSSSKHHPVGRFTVSALGAGARLLLSILMLSPVRGQLDVGFSRPLPAERRREFHEELVYTDYLHLLLIPAHPLARNLADGRTTMPVKRLSGERFVLLHRQAAPGIYDEVLALWRRADNFSPHVVNEPDRISTVLLLVESGIGVPEVSRIEPALTTVRQDSEEKGQRAAKFLLEMLDGQAEENRHSVLAVELVVRKSTGKAR
jgi:DNA-binding transcriptional LysR family regulator